MKPGNVLTCECTPPPWHAATSAAPQAAAASRGSGGKFEKHAVVIVVSMRTDLLPDPARRGYSTASLPATRGPCEPTYRPDPPNISAPRQHQNASPAGDTCCPHEKTGLGIPRDPPACPTRLTRRAPPAPRAAGFVFIALSRTACSTPT